MFSKPSLNNNNLFSPSSSLIVVITIIACLLINLQTNKKVDAQSSTNANSLLLDGTRFSESICYSSSNNLRRQTITLTTPPTAAIPILRLAPGPKQVVNCLDLIEVQSGSSATGGLCNSLASLQLCSGPLGSEPLAQTDCQTINTAYTQPKARIEGGSLNSDDKEWSLRYDGTSYSDLCFPRSVQLLAFTQAEGPGSGSVVLLIVVLVIVFGVLVCLGLYLFYRCRRCLTNKEFDYAINHHYNGGARTANFNRGGGYEDHHNDVIYDENGEPVEDPNAQQEMQQEGDEDQPPGLPKAAHDMVVMDEHNAYGGGGGYSPQSNARNPAYITDDGPRIYQAGPLASIYGSDIERDFSSVGRGYPQGGGGGGPSQGRKSASMFRVLPEVHVNPLPPVNQQQQQEGDDSSPAVPRLSSTASYNFGGPQTSNNNQDNNNNNNNDRVTVCADCGVNVDAEDCPPTCEITGKAHY